jgi:hypothetical protein
VRDDSQVTLLGVLTAETHTSYIGPYQERSGIRLDMGGLEEEWWDLPGCRSYRPSLAQTSDRQRDRAQPNRAGTRAASPGKVDSQQEARKKQVESGVGRGDELVGGDLRLGASTTPQPRRQTMGSATQLCPAK